jgi:lipopolysaccharide transport system permease protein
MNRPAAIEKLPIRAAEDLTVIEPAGSFLTLDARSLWAYRELFYFLALRDIKVRYKQTVLGVAWVLLQPIATTLIFSVLFVRFGQTKAFGVAYPLFAFSGFVLWTFVNGAVTNASNSLINHTGLITKVYFPRLIVPMAAVAANLLDLAIGLLTLTAALVFYRVAPTWKLLLAPLFVLQIFVLSLGAGILLAALNVRFRDVKQLLPFILQLWLFVSPVFYSLELLPENLAWIWKLNPLAGLLENFRAALFGQEFDFAGIAFSVVMTMVVFAFALYVFRIMEDDFADVI